MTARFFADTNVAVYALDADPRRHEREFSIMRQSPVISAQIVNEFLSVLTRKKGVPRERANRYARIMLRRCEVVSVTVQVVETAIFIGERYQMSHWDALVVAAALLSGCDTPYGPLTISMGSGLTAAALSAIFPRNISSTL